MQIVPTKLHQDDTLESISSLFEISVKDILKINGNIPYNKTQINNWVLATGGQMLSSGYAMFTNNSVIFLPEKNSDYLQGKANQSLSQFREELNKNKETVEKVDNKRTKPPSFARQKVSPDVDVDLSKFMPRTAEEAGVNPNTIPPTRLPDAKGNKNLLIGGGIVAIVAIAAFLSMKGK